MWQGRGGEDETKSEPEPTKAGRAACAMSSFAFSS